ncbi:MAG: adenylate/guanylate cyclase domain-containing protein [Opitutales bacterium]|nr:adenylate/guanylate cyclase domain-containing protein [Opitutales bacterium]
MRSSLGYFAFLLATVVAAPLLSKWLMKQPLVRQYEEQTIGHRLSLRQPAETTELHPVYLLQDDLSLTRLGPHPWNRRAYGDYLSMLHRWSKPSVVGFDYIFDSKGHIFAREGNRRFAEILTDYQPTVLAAAYSVGYRDDGRFVEFPLLRDGYKEVESNPLPALPESELQQPGNYVGLINVVEPFLQLVPAFAETPEGTFYAMAIVMACLHLGLDPAYIDHDRRFIYLRDAEEKIVRRIPLEQGQLFRINWLRPWGFNETHSLYDVSVQHAVLQSTNRDLSDLDKSLEFFEAFEGRMVLIAPGDSLSKDLSPTPLDALAPRVSVIGNSIETILSERYLKRTSTPTLSLLTALFAFLICASLIWERPPPILRYTAAFFWLGLFILSSYVAIHFDLILPIVGPSTSLTAVSLIAFSAHLLVIERKRNHIHRLFQSYVSPAVVRQLVRDEHLPALGGREQVVTALFTDIQGFSGFSEKLDASSMVQFLNAYMDEMTRPVLRCHGTLDKYIGDALVALFGAPVADPHHAFHGLQAACQMMRNEDRINREWPLRHPNWPLPVYTRIGINTGPAVVGNMGSSVRFNYTMMGDSVNTASRMESAARHYGVRALISGDTINRLSPEQLSLFAVRQIDRVVVKGRQAPTDIWQLIGHQDPLTNEEAECLNFFNKGFSAYLKGDWTTASSELQKSLPRESNAQGLNPSRVLIERIAAVSGIAPKGWDGVFHMELK